MIVDADLDRMQDRQSTNIVIKTQPNEKSSIERSEDSLYDQIKKKYSQQRQSIESLNMAGSIGSSSTGKMGTREIDQALVSLQKNAAQTNALDTIEVEQSQACLDIKSIIRKYGGASADATWASELDRIEKQQKRKPNYLESNESESVNSSIQEEAYQRIKQKYAAMAGNVSNEETSKLVSWRSNAQESAINDGINAREIIIEEQQERPKKTSPNVTEYARYGSNEKHNSHKRVNTEVI